MSSCPPDTACRLKQAADAICDADALLMCSGAGMGVDSGFGTFRGRSAGVWPPLTTLRMDYSAMTDPKWFEKDSRLAWAYWHFCHQAYTRGTPHEGYDLLANWGQGLAYGCFSVTSNIDGHWERALGSDRIHEVHGAVTHLQGVKDDWREGGDAITRIWPACPTEISCMEVPQWDLEAGDSVEALPRYSPQQGWIPAVVGEDGCSIMGDGKRLAAKGVRRPGGPDLLRVAEHSDLPKCPKTGQLARPNVLMFEDRGMNFGRVNEQERNYDRWRAALPPDAKLVIIEVGAGTAIPTIRSFSEGVAFRLPQSTFIRINFDESEVPEEIADRSVSIGQVGALEVLRRINALMGSVECVAEVEPQVYSGEAL